MAHVGQTELLYLNKEKAYPGFVLFAAAHQELGMNTYLIDIEGRLINTWDIGNMPRFLDNGNVSDFADKRRVKGGPYGFRELDWDGKIVQEVLLPETLSSRAKLHHQKQRIFNKALNAYTYISIVSIHIIREEGLAAGADPSKCTGDSGPDGIIEVDMSGNVVWEWWSMDHVIQDKYPDKANYVGKGKKISDYPGKLDLNWGPGLRGDFVHFNSIDYNPTLGQIAVNNSTGSEFWIIDHDKTFIPGDYEASKALAASDTGDFVYRWGTPSIYGAGEEPSWEHGESSLGDDQVFFTHGIHWIPEGLPGAGNFLYFDNNSRRMGTSFSQVLEINPYDGPMKNGVYVPLMEAGFDEDHISKQIVWSYRSRDYGSFFAELGSCASRLPNGNTFVATSRGEMFQVTPEGELVWEYVVPIRDEGIRKVIIDMHGEANNIGFPLMYGPDHPALKGKDLIPMDTITELAIQGKLGQDISEGIQWPRKVYERPRI